MPATAVQHVTFAEFEAMPEQPGKQELLRGELIELPPAKRRHNGIAERIFIALRTTRPPGKVHHEMGYRFSNADIWLIPDVSLTHEGQPGDDYYADAPALAVEVVSESNSAAYIARKIKEYLSHGGLEVWVLYPEQERLSIHRPDGSSESHTGTFQSPLLGDATINVAELLKED